jgi:polyisoprenyl-phosphate glycosyltransferase
MDESNKIELSVVVPVYNEEQVLRSLMERLENTLASINATYEIIFVNDGSRDTSLQILKEFCASHQHLHYISFSRNFGHQVAISAGMDYAAGNAIVTIDGDLQDPPELIADMYQQYLAGNKVVYAKRIKRKGETFSKKANSWIFYRMFARIVSFEIPVDVGDFRLISRDVLEYLIQMDEYDKYLRGQIAWLGFKSAYVPYDRDERKYGTSNYPFRKSLKLAFNGITSFSDKPLQMVTKMGFIVCLISGMLGLYTLYSYFFKKENAPGWASLMITITFLGGVQLLSIGIIGEYISRIINNVRKRPLYVIDQASEGIHRPHR